MQDHRQCLSVERGESESSVGRWHWRLIGDAFRELLDKNAEIRVHGAVTLHNKRLEGGVWRLQVKMRAVLVEFPLVNLARGMEWGYVAEIKKIKANVRSDRDIEEKRVACFGMCGTDVPAKIADTDVWFCNSREIS